MKRLRIPWAFGVGAMLSMHVGAAASPQRDDASVAAAHRESLPADSTAASGSASRSAEPRSSHRTAAIAQQRKIGADVRSSTQRVRSLLDAQARGRAGLQVRGRPALQAHRTVPSGSSGRTASATSGSIARAEPGPRGPAAASTTAVPRVMGRPLATVNAVSNTNAAVRNSRIGGPYVGGHATVAGTATVGGPALGRNRSAGKIDGSPLRHGS